MIKGNKGINDYYIKSRWQQLGKLLSQAKVPGLKIKTLKHEGKDVITVVGEYKPKKIIPPGQKGFEEQQLDLMFLDKNGLIREDRVSAIFRQIERTQNLGREVINTSLPSANDYRYIKYQITT